MSNSTLGCEIFGFYPLLLSKQKKNLQIETTLFVSVCTVFEHRAIYVYFYKVICKSTIWVSDIESSSLPKFNISEPRFKSFFFCYFENFGLSTGWRPVLVYVFKFPSMEFCENPYMFKDHSYITLSLFGIFPPLRQHVFSTKDKQKLAFSDPPSPLQALT